MIVLGIETSCDETSAAVVKNGREVLSNIIASQVEIHAEFGGVVPEIAARKHIECIGYIVTQALEQAGVRLEEIDAYAVANGPGLAGALLVGLNYAKGLAFVHKKPIVGVNHIEGHVCANFLSEGEASRLRGDIPTIGQSEESNEAPRLRGDIPTINQSEKRGNAPPPPFMALVVSGGHTLLIAVDDYNSYRVVASTRDDAAGEAFDKVARVLGLPYPGGPEIDKAARAGTPSISFPRAKIEGYDFSFSGLKTAVMQYVRKAASPNFSIPDVAASFQKAVVDVLADNAVKACLHAGYTKIALAGGVACNSALRQAMTERCAENGLQLFMPAPIFCTDNAAMIASRGYYRVLENGGDGLGLNAFPGRMGNA
ncbi:MAG: tRNA (adenosine(37)-N6)-threonylcarbamoyltransferase complex transferase subunit TsaD [Defluviitaleaceae bacterium]|nr:tRNA (adenosine(37)-N6)-threonylcarbamoyltransferase complex transferase subunit TsaD [Defluviitaleaceae bacterium]